MDYKLKIGEQIFPVQAAPLDEAGSAAFIVDGKNCSVVVRSVAPYHLHVQVNGRSMNLFTVATDAGTWVWAEGRARLVLDAETQERKKSRTLGETPGEVTPPTPAGVVRVLVAVGDEVVKKQALVVVSAMKMEMTLTAPYSGTVTAVNAQVGDQVSPGQILVEIKASEQGDQNE